MYLGYAFIARLCGGARGRRADPRWRPLPRGYALARVWNQIPDDVQILITHTPPQGILDSQNEEGLTGCADLTARVEQLSNLKLHVFGHIHEGYGMRQLGHTLFVNACACDHQYRPVNPPIVVDL